MDLVIRYSEDIDTKKDGSCVDTIPTWVAEYRDDANNNRTFGFGRNMLEAFNDCIEYKGCISNGK